LPIPLPVVVGHKTNNGGTGMIICVIVFEILPHLSQCLTACLFLFIDPGAGRHCADRKLLLVVVGENTNNGGKISYWKNLVL